MKLGDRILIILFLTLITALLTKQYWLPSQSDSVAQGTTYANISLDGQLYRKVELTEQPQEIEIQTERGYDLLQISEFGIQVLDSDCPLKICMTYGTINKPGEIIVCLPNRMLIEIKSWDNLDSQVDAIVS